MGAEKDRLEEDRLKKKHWRRWGPYLSERQWGTVREDLSADGHVWESLTFDKAASQAYRWGEDGIAGLCDNHQRLCFAWTFWNEEDSILKERLFGLSGPEGNHGEDVKELYFYVDNTPTHSYMQYLYKYPHKKFPYEKLVQEGKNRGTRETEYELLDTGVFAENRYFDCVAEYAKQGPDDVWIRMTVTNRGPEEKKIHIFGTLWYRNTWSWGGAVAKPLLEGSSGKMIVNHPELQGYRLSFAGEKEVLFTENETGLKDAFHRYVVLGEKEAVNTHPAGTKSAIHFEAVIKSGESQSFLLRLGKEEGLQGGTEVFSNRKKEADEFYQEVCSSQNSEDLKKIQRQALSGLLWNKQYYRMVVDEWMKASPRSFKRNQEWEHLFNEDILSMPDKWEYPYFCSWDTAFHALPLAMMDPEFAKKQLTLLTREWYMHPSGQLPAYEWAFKDVNPPVHAWAAWRTFKIEQKSWGREDRVFLESVFQKLLLNFTWWVNRKDIEGKNIFHGGFLGLDNIGIFNRTDLPPGTKLYQSDATSWMGMYSLNMLVIALELAQKNPSYEDMASKFFEHFLYISQAMNYTGEGAVSLWDEEDGFYYDVIVLPSGEWKPLKVRSLVGLIPLLSVATASPDHLNQFPGFRKRMEWFIDHRTDLCGSIAPLRRTGQKGHKIISLTTPDRLRRILQRMLDEKEFLSPYGIRSLSKYHEEHPYVLTIDGKEYKIDYEPAESWVRLYGGNSNWRGPVWFPLNMLLIEALQKYHYYFGDEFKVECPTGSGNKMNLWEVASEISRRLVKIYTPDGQGCRPVYGSQRIFDQDPYFKDNLLFFEYFHGDNGAGIGASHQTGWTGLIAKLIQQLGTHKN